MDQQDLIHNSNEGEAPIASKSTTFLKTLSYIFFSIFVLGLVQLVAWAGNGQKDPFFPEVTVLQTTAVIASLIQIVAFVPAFYFQTEKFYDLTGSITYLTCIGYSFGAGYQASIVKLGNPIDERAIIASCFVILWAMRLGYFLFTRVLQSRKDGRFDEIKPNFFLFFLVWNIQGLWCFLGCLPTFIINSTQVDTGFFWTDVVGGILFVFGFALEILSDNQKSNFNASPLNKGKWINVGLWKYSRHPNYFFEWLLQFGLFVFCASEFVGSQFVAAASPIFTAILLALISGVPLLEKRADEKWGDQPEYQRYKRSTSVCIPMWNLPAEEDEMFCGQSILVNSPA